MTPEQLEKLTRYDCYSDYTGGTMRENDHGDYVLFDDVATLCQSIPDDVRAAMEAYSKHLEANGK